MQLRWSRKRLAKSSDIGMVRPRPSRPFAGLAPSRRDIEAPTLNALPARSTSDRFRASTSPMRRPALAISQTIAAWAESTSSAASRIRNTSLSRKARPSRLLSLGRCTPSAGFDFNAPSETASRRIADSFWSAFARVADAASNRDTHAAISGCLIDPTARKPKVGRMSESR